jgi:predicted N-acetyltransferase YhbS
LLTGLVGQSLGGGPIPTSLVAHEGEEFLGTVALIECDEETRPQYTPWVAALWVEPEYRRRGIGAALVHKASELAFRAGENRVYLLTRERRLSFYEGLGWQVLEANASEAGLFILKKDRPA